MSELTAVTISSFEEVLHVTFIIFIIIAFRFDNYCGVKINVLRKLYKNEKKKHAVERGS